MARRKPIRDRLAEVWRRDPPDAAAGTERTAEGEQVRTPSRREFLGNLEKVAGKPLSRRDGGPEQ